MATYSDIMVNEKEIAQENPVCTNTDEVYTEIQEEDVALANYPAGSSMWITAAGIAMAVVFAIITSYVSFGKCEEAKYTRKR